MSEAGLIVVVRVVDVPETVTGVARSRIYDRMCPT